MKAASSQPWALFVLFLLAIVSLPLRAAPSEPLLVLSYHDVRDDVARVGDADDYAIDTQNLIAHLDWLRANDYHPISLSQLIDASEGRGTLPAKPVLLTFDDGLRSMYTHVYPLLRAYGYPAVAAVITTWVDLPEGQQVEFGPRPFTRDDFLTWEQIREMHASGLVEIASHTHDMHRSVLANPLGSMTPAVTTHRYDAGSGGYEDETSYAKRLRDDLQRSSNLIRQHTGRAPRAVVWPYAAYNDVANGIADSLGMKASFDLKGRAEEPLGRDLHGLARLLIEGNPRVADLAYEVRRPRLNPAMRAMQIDLDAIYDPDPAQQQRNLDLLIERVKRIKPSHVFLQAFADPDGNGSADALYFPNRHLPMRADLFSFTSWQLRTRAGVVVYAWMPVLGFELSPATRIGAGPPSEIHRVDFTNPATARAIREVFEDLGLHSYFEGVLFHDDAYLRDNELPQLAEDDAGRTQALIDFTLTLKDAAGRYRPKLRTVRNLYATPVLEPRSQAWFAQRLDLFNKYYDYTALMAMPWLAESDDQQAWLDSLVHAVREQDPELTQTIFEMQTFDWRRKEPIPARILKQQFLRLSASGVRHFAWYPDDVIRGIPSTDEATEIMSARSFPYREP